jgi:hypothetical protein
MKTKADPASGGFVIALIVGGALITNLWAAFSCFEARAYRAVTGREVSTWQAMFLDLQVEAPPR